jgi:hypothetical protein
MVSAAAFNNNTELSHYSPRYAQKIKQTLQKPFSHAFLTKRTRKKAQVSREINKENTHACTFQASIGRGEVFTPSRNP